MKISVNFSFPANFYSLHPLKLKLRKYLHDDVEQRILFQGYSAPPNIGRVMPLCKVSLSFRSLLFRGNSLQISFYNRNIFASTLSYGQLGKLFIYLFFIFFLLDLNENVAIIKSL